MKKLLHFVYLTILLFTNKGLFSQNCLPQTFLNVNSITTNSATLIWNNSSATDTKWQILLIPSETATLPTIAPPVDPDFPGQILQTIEAPNVSPYQISGLEPAQIYFYYIRTICSDTEVSAWSNPFYFNTTTCETANKCNYKFFLTNVNGNSWNGGRMQVRQNGILIQTLGATLINTSIGVTVPLCPNESVELFWNIAGTFPENIGITIISPQNDIVYSKPAGQGVPLTLLHNQQVSCTPELCPKPIMPFDVNVATIGTTSALVSWTEQGTATQWEVFVTPFGSAPPVNGTDVIATSSTPIASNSGFYYLSSLSQSLTVEGLIAGTTYQYYVRALCSLTERSNWTLVNPISFSTKPINDECINAIEVPVNPILNCDPLLNVQGNILGSTLSLPTILGCTSSNNDVWFKFTATNTSHLISISNIVNFPSTATLSVYHMLLSGPCSNLEKIYCNASSQSVADGLVIGNTYYIRAFTGFTSIVNSISFNLCISTPTTVSTNDECSSSIPIIVNNFYECSTNTSGNIISATASSQVLGADPTNSPCYGTANDDVWFSFVATSATQIVSLLNIEGTTSNLNHAIYSGTCENLVRVNCSTLDSLQSISNNLIIGNSYFIRVWSFSASNQIVTFNICVKAVSSCQNADYFCGSTTNDPYIYQNSVGISGLVGSACLFTTPNPTFFNLKVEESGNLAYTISQNSSFDIAGNPSVNVLDVDFVAWGPFNSASECDQIVQGPCTPVPCPNNSNSLNFYPAGNIVDCSYSGSSTETLTINNAVEGQYYKVLITNFSNDDGYIKFIQTNYGEPNAGKTSCTDKLLLVAFVDTNNNGLKDANENNFQYGSFSYQKNNTGNTTEVTSPFGKHSIYDNDTTSLYDASYEVFSEYQNYYAVVSTNFNDISIPLNSGTQTLLFPVTILQTYTDLEVSLVSLTPAIAGSTYTSKIIYKNKGITPVSGTLSFTNDQAVSIDNISQDGTISNSAGFDYSFSNLMSNETRKIFVTMTVPSIPIVNINDILNFNIIATTIETDVNLNNNSFSNSQIVVASYDPNDKMESHGEKILFSDFDSSDYLNYTIRFENTGTSNAINIRLEDVLDSKLDESTIRVIDASHNYNMQRINNNVTWTFENIQLPPTQTNPELSKGYVFFKIKPKPGYAIGDIIPNFANIYFDSNPAIMTNTFTTEFVSTLASSSFDTSNFMIYPNPAKEIIQVNLKNTNEKLESIQINDVLGKTIYKADKLNTNSQSVEISNLSKGLYFVEITNQSKLKQTKKLLVE